jgi:hypothetical protein
MRNQKKIRRGSILPLVLVFGSFFLVVLVSLLGYVESQRGLSIKKVQREEAFNISEAGLAMYRWHIASELDGKIADDIQNYWDGSPLGVPFYEREYKDPQGKAVGKYRLEVTVPEPGSTIIDAKITGWNYLNPNAKRIIKARFRKPAWSEFAVVANDVMRFGEGTEVWGKIHSNDGIRFDGIAHNLVSSARDVYWDPDTSSQRPGVWTSKSDPGDVFLAGTAFPLATADFTGITGDLRDIKTNAQSGGLYLAKTTGSYKNGYRLNIKTNGTVDVYRVKTRGAVSYQIQSETFLRNYPLPANGLIFVEDDATIEGTLNNKYLTIVAADITSGGSFRNIFLEKDLVYAHRNGSEILGLIAQGSIKIGLFSNNVLKIDGALIAQNGNVGRDYFTSGDSSTYYKRDTITVYGAIATNQRYGFSWGCPTTYCSGYKNRNLIFDSELINKIPPFFPTQNSYGLDMWEEEK